MTLEEFTAHMFDVQKQVAKQESLVDEINDAQTRLHEEALKGPREQLAILREAADEEERKHRDQVEGLFPFARFDFITRGDGRYYEVTVINLHVSTVAHDALTPPERFLTVYLRGHEIRQSGIRSIYENPIERVRLHDMGGYRKVSLEEDPRLKRAIKQRMRRRLEGGD